MSKLSDSWRTSTNTKRAKHGGGFGGVDSLEKKRHYKAQDHGSSRQDRHRYVYDEEELRKRHERDEKYSSEKREHSRSRSPQRERTVYNTGSETKRDDGRRSRNDRDHYHDRGRDGGNDRRADHYRR